MGSADLVPIQSSTTLGQPSWSGDTSSSNPHHGRGLRHVGPRRKWSTREIEILTAEWGKTPGTDLARKLGRTVHAIGKKRENLKLHPTRASRWGDSETDRIAALWREGKSASEIAAELGCTRNAVIGKVHRLGLSSADKARHHSKSPCRNLSPEELEARRERHRLYMRSYSKTPKGRAQQRRYKKKNKPTKPHGPTALPILHPVPGHLGHSLEEVTGCRFMPGDEHLCCGLDRREGSSWCPEHHRMVYAA